MPVSYPFSSMVINFNVVTNGHRDAQDLKACLVLVVGDHEGGEVCLAEPGLVLPLRSGDFVVFPSCAITHFNMHYIGTRASVVLHSDREGHSSATNGRSWADNDYYI